MRLDRPAYHGSDQVLLGTLAWLAEYFPELYDSLSAPYHNPDTSVSEIDRYKRWATEQGERAEQARQELTKIRRAKNRILDALEMVKWVDLEGKIRHGHKLVIPSAKRAKLKEVAVPKERRPKIVEEFLEHYRATGSVPRAVALTARFTDHQKSWIYFVTEDERRRIRDEKSLSKESFS